MLIYGFAATETYTGELAARHALLLELKRIVEASGTDFAAPLSDVTWTLASTDLAEASD